MKTLRRLLAGGLLVAAIGLTTSSILPTSAGQAAAPSLADGNRSSHRATPPKRYYLALGDSLAFGYQEWRLDAEIESGTYDPATFNTGYVDDFLEMMQDMRPNIDAVNLGCPQETSVTLVEGGCPFPLALHQTYTGSQLDAAVAFLEAHPGQVSPITLNIGANDFQNAFKSCSDDITCAMGALPGVLATIGSNFEIALAELRAAAPNAEIIVLTQYNPYAGVISGVAPAFVALNSMLTTIAQDHDARVADGSGMVTGANFCDTTLLCTPAVDFHPSDAGYQALADAIWAVAGFEKFVD